MDNFRTTLMNGVRSLMALSLAMTVLNLYATVAFASPPTSPVARGTLNVNGVVTVDGLRALSGQTILSGSQIVTASKSNSILDLGNLTRLLLSEQTELALNFSAASISGSLRQGEVRAFIPAGRTLSIATPDGVVATDSKQAAVLSIQVEADVTHIAVETGQVELRAGNNRRVMSAGETFSTAFGSFAVPPPPALNLTKGERAGIFAAIGAGIAILLVAITVGKHKETAEFGGCAIVLSPGAGNGMCH